MPFNVGTSINNITQTAIANPGLRHIAENPFYTAIAIVVIIMLTILIVFRNSENDDPLFVMALRTGFWCFIGVSFILLMHDKLLIQEDAASIPDLFTGTPITGEYESLVVPIIEI
jgi:hypothetical protein